MTYTVTRDGLSLGTYSIEGINRQVDNGVFLPTDLVLPENQQQSMPISELLNAAYGASHEIAQFVQQVQDTTPTAFVTPALIAINILVFIVMVVAGVSPLQPSNSDLIGWGADFGPFTTHGQWWRLLTAAFLHAGIIHVGFNMWALFSGGIFTERLYGNAGFLALYLLAAIGGDLASIWSHPLITATGASGAIFGVYGALFAFIVPVWEG